MTRPEPELTRRAPADGPGDATPPVPGAHAQPTLLEGLPVNLVTRPGPRIGKALEAVAEALHPDAFR